MVVDSLRLRHQPEPDLPRVESPGAEVPGTRTYLSLWAALTCITVIVVFVPGIPVALYEPRLSIAVGSVSGVVGLGLLQLGLVRFQALRRPIDLHAGLAFGALAVSNLFTAWAPLSGGVAELPLERAADLLLLTRATAAVLFLSGLASNQRHQRGTAWKWSGPLGLICAALFALLAVGALLIKHSGGLPMPLLPAALEVLSSGKPVADLPPGQNPSLVLANATLAIAFSISAIGYTAEGQRTRDPYIAALAAGLILISFGQLHGVRFPALPTEYLASGDMFYLVANGLLLSNIVWRTAQDFAASVTQVERMRLSRELHDGLIQQLAMVRLRLGRSADETGLSDQCRHDLDVAQHVLASASLEARRAIAALRSEPVPWQEFVQALNAFSTEFSLTHEIDAQVWTEPCDRGVDSQLQADALRILQEAFSNAARHGRADRIDAVVARAGEMLRVTVQDHGLGFEPGQVRRGVGLRSMAERVERRQGRLIVDSAPGKGTRIQASLPMRAPRPRFA